MHIAVIGTGIAGLTASWLLNRSGHEVTLFEKQSTLGMASHGMQIAIDEVSLPCDVPSRMFNPLLWPNLSKVYDIAGVESTSVNPSKSFCPFRPQNETRSKAWLKLNDSFQLSLLPQLLLQSSSRKIVKDIAKMMATAGSELERIRSSDSNSVESFKAYLERYDYSNEFIYQFLYPALASTVCTCSYESLDQYPTDILLSAMQLLIGSTPLQRTVNGTQHTADLLSAGVSRMNFNTTVANVSSTDDKAMLEIENQGSNSTHDFDHVIVATQANSALAFLDPKMRLEKEILAGFKYEDVSVVIHSDPHWMPARKQDWATFNFLSRHDSQAAMCSIWLNQFYPEWETPTPLFQTIMPLESPRPETLLATAKLQRPTVSANTKMDIDRLHNLHEQPDRRVWFCGSYASPGIPLLESGVVSALRLGKQLGFKIPNACEI